MNKKLKLLNVFLIKIEFKTRTVSTKKALIDTKNFVSLTIKN